MKQTSMMDKISRAFLSSFISVYNLKDKLSEPQHKQKNNKDSNKHSKSNLYISSHK